MLVFRVQHCLAAPEEAARISRYIERASPLLPAMTELAGESTTPQPPVTRGLPPSVVSCSDHRDTYHVGEQASYP